MHCYVRGDQNCVPDRKGDWVNEAKNTEELDWHDKYRFTCCWVKNTCRWASGGSVDGGKMLRIILIWLYIVIIAVWGFPVDNYYLQKE